MKRSKQPCIINWDASLSQKLPIDSADEAIVYADGTEELYDHEKDKWEWHNLAADPEYANVKEKMRKGIPAHHEPTGAYAF